MPTEKKFCNICLVVGKKLYEVERLDLCYKCKARVKAGLRSKTYHNK